MYGVSLHLEGVNFSEVCNRCAVGGRFTAIFIHMNEDDDDEQTQRPHTGPDA